MAESLQDATVALQSLRWASTTLTLACTHMVDIMAPCSGFSKEPAEAEHAVRGKSQVMVTTSYQHVWVSAADSE